MVAILSAIAIVTVSITTKKGWALCDTGRSP